MLRIRFNGVFLGVWHRVNCFFVNSILIIDNSLNVQKSQFNFVLLFEIGNIIMVIFKCVVLVKENDLF